MLEREKLSDKLAKIVGDKIIYNELKSGDVIYETQLSKEWGVSRSPVRDALHWLERNRLVEKAPKGSYKVTVLTYDYIESFFDAVNMFYGYSFARATKYLTKNDLEFILATTDKIDESVKNKEFEMYLEQVMAFGKIVLATANNPIIAQSAIDLIPMAKRILFLAIDISPSNLKESAKFVRLSYENLFNKKPQKAETSFIAFANISRDVLLKHFKR
jgi:DNA-binding GntR family transcriptional regulator